MYMKKEYIKLRFTLFMIAKRLAPCIHVQFIYKHELKIFFFNLPQWFFPLLVRTDIW